MKSNSASMSARMVATFRALHQRLPDSRRINTDPFADKFVIGGIGQFILKSPFLTRCMIGIKPNATALIASRDRFSEEWARRTLKGRSQVLLLGAGYDPVTQRLQADFPETLFFEVDHPATQEAKLKFLTQRNLKLPPDRCRFVASNFEIDDLKAALFAAGFDTQLPTVVNWMGVTYFLHLPAIHQTFTALDDLLAPGSIVTLDFFYKANNLQKSGFGWFLKQFSEPIISVFTNEEIAALAMEHHFEPVEVISAAAFATRQSSFPDYQNIVGGLAALRKL